MFEVGKRYKYYSGKNVATCVAIHGEVGWLIQDNDRSPVTYGWGPKWEEYIEPKVHVMERDVYIARDQMWVVGCAVFPAHRPEEGYRIRLTLTEGQGLAVEVIG